jgi:phenylacetate-CoA ligase
MERIAGRTFDMVVGTNGSFVSGTFWTLLFRSVAGIDMFQVHQDKENSLRILLQTDSRFRKESVSDLSILIRNTCGREMLVDIELVDDIPPSASGKHRFVTSDVARAYFS